MMDVLKRIFIGIIVGMSIFFLKTTVFALSLDDIFVESVSFAFSESTTRSFSLASSSDGQSSFDFTVSSDVTVSTSGYLVFPYTFTLYNIEGQITSTQYQTHVNDFGLRARLFNHSGDSPFCEFQNNFIVCPVSDSGSYYDLRIYYSRFSDTGGGVNKFSFTLSNVANLVITDFGSAIDSQTEDLENMDEQASATYNNDYSTNSYDQAEQSMNQNLNVDVSSFTFNPLSWSRSFGWIWDTVDDFVNINAKVFLTITTFLTFSFVGLVIGRS